MKVAFKGKVEMKGQLKVKPKRRVASSAATLQAIRRAVRLEMGALRARIRRDVRRELFSQRFANFIGSAVENADNDQVYQMVLPHLNEAVAVTTPAGPVSGTLIHVLSEFLIIQESPNTVLLVPYQSVIGIRSL